MLGNDIVDLQDADSRPESFRPRFDARVFTKEERRAIARGRDSLARRWAHWASKEAAFKLCKRIDSALIWSPSSFAVEFDPLRADAGRRVLRRGRVRRKSDSTSAPAEVEVRSVETEDYVHVVAVPVGADWGAVDLGVEALESGARDSSVAVRQLAIREISRSLGVEPHRLAIGRLGASASGWRGGPVPTEFGSSDASDPSRVPTVELDAVPTSLSLSLSHHGRFVSFAMTPHITAQREVEIHRAHRSESPTMLASSGATRS
jgi:hypothetical protein